MIRILLIVIAVLVLVSGGLWVRTLQLDADNIQLESDKQTLNDNISQYEATLQSKNNTIATLKNTVKKRDELVTKQHQQNKVLQIQLDQKQEALKHAIKTNKVVADYANQPVPDDIDQLLNPSIESPG